MIFVDRASGKRLYRQRMIRGYTVGWMFLVVGFGFRTLLATLRFANNLSTCIVVYGGIGISLLISATLLSAGVAE